MTAMTEKEAFHFGFLLRCADEQLTPEQLRDRIKQAAMGGIASAALKIPLTLGAAGLGLAGVGGAATGYGLARMGDDPASPEEVRKQELITAYKQYAERAKRTAARIRYRLAATPSRR